MTVRDGRSPELLDIEVFEMFEEVELPDLAIGKWRVVVASLTVRGGRSPKLLDIEMFEEGELTDLSPLKKPVAISIAAGLLVTWLLKPWGLSAWALGR